MDDIAVDLDRALVEWEKCRKAARAAGWQGEAQSRYLSVGTTVAHLSMEYRNAELRRDGFAPLRRP